ncbi:MAG: hypothetical protein M1541_18155 [Acidobacteria bacterium]|nr:hypothetical protein [Acidobacteriota bacterium]
MQYLLAVLIPPLYFLMKKKWVGFIVSSFLLVLSVFLFMTVVLIPGALIAWALCSVVAVWDLRKQLMNEHATMIAEKMAEKMQQQARPPSAPPAVGHS